MGCLSGGYVVIRIAGYLYRAHRLAWLYMTGEWPALAVDHVNRNPSDNRWANLRQATPRQNGANSKPRGAHGLKGVHLHTRNRRWVAQIKKGGTTVYLGSFDTPAEAHAAYAAEARSVFGPFMRLREHSSAAEPAHKPAPEWRPTTWAMPAAETDVPWHIFARFLEKVVPEPNSGCWLWLGATRPGGHGHMQLDGRRFEGAHRVSYRCFRGSIPAGVVVCHVCDTPICVNPVHLWLGSVADNMADCIRKHRAWHNKARAA